MLSFSASLATPPLGNDVVVTVPEHPNVREAASAGDARKDNVNTSTVGHVRHVAQTPIRIFMAASV
jgi:hypothetical protein